MWKTILTVVGVLFLVSIVIFLYLLIAGADESRRRVNCQGKNKDKEDSE